MYECFHCGHQSVIWDCDFTFDEGLVHIYHCANCGAEIEYRIPIPDEEETDKEI